VDGGGRVIKKRRGKRKEKKKEKKNSRLFINFSFPTGSTFQKENYELTHIPDKLKTETIVTIYLRC